jgi:hypothetical protein
MSSQPPPERDPKDAENEAAETARFERLAKGLFGVPRDKVAEAEREYVASRTGGIPATKSQS